MAIYDSDNQRVEIHKVQFDGAIQPDGSVIEVALLSCYRPEQKFWRLEDLRELHADAGAAEILAAALRAYTKQDAGNYTLPAWEGEVRDE